MTNTLYYGDNLAILRHKVASESVDLVYLDPPFNSNADYNVIFREQSGQMSSAQIQAFTDTWHWDTDHTERAFEEVLTTAPQNVAKMLEAMVSFIGRNDLTAYLVMMTQRLIELHRVLKPTGSLYLHCDPTASHYLKIVLDTIFGPDKFVNEIAWQRTSAHNDPSRYGRVHDVILFYCKGDKRIWATQYDAPDEAYFAAHDFENDSAGRLYRKRDLTAPAHGGLSGQFEWKGRRPPSGRMWSYTLENMERLEQEGRITYTQSGMPRLKIYADELRGVPMQDVWARSELWLNSAAQERLGYPTQKPLALLERIISASSNPGDVVVDPFCGCGTAICAAQKLGRQWIGIDVTHLAVSLMKGRLKAMFDLEPNREYVVDGEPKDVQSARQLALDSRYQFQYWAVSLIEAMAQEQHEKKKGADKGIDGVISFIDGANRHRETIIVQVKSGHVTSSHIRDLKGVLEREKAAIGLYICLEKPTRDMHEEAASAGFYTSDLWPGAKGDHRWPRIQMRTVEELLAGQTFAIPPRPVQFKRAERVAVLPSATAQELWSAPTAQDDPLDTVLPESDEEEYEDE